MMSHFRYVADYDVAPIAAAVAAHDDLFKAESWRQDYPGSPHAGSETIFLRAPRHGTVRSILYSLDCEDRPAVLFPEFRAALEFISDAERMPLARAMVIRLLPHAVVAEHTDVGTYADRTERYHLPIVTSTAVVMTVDGEHAALPPGEVWWFDKHAPHSVVNGGDAARVHLVVDLFKC